MLTGFLLLGALSFSEPHSQSGAATDGFEHRIIFLGDGGAWHEAGPLGAVQAGLAGQIRRDFWPGRTHVIWLGDNVYDHGLPPASGPCSPNTDRQRQERVQGEAALRWQVEVSPDPSRVLLVAGNHDWAAGCWCGLARRIEQETFVERTFPGVQLLPDQGCPGPTVVDDLPGIRLIAYDSEWLLRESHKPIAGCTAGLRLAAEASAEDVRQAFLQSLEEAIRSRGDRRVLLAAHHPLRTKGPHGGHGSGWRWIFPFRDLKGPWRFIPVPGLNVVRVAFPIRQDLASGPYKRMIRDLEGVVDRTGPGSVLAHLAGHEHSLQLFAPDKRGIVQIVSGTAAKRTAVQRARGAVSEKAAMGLEPLFAESLHGYVRLDFGKGGARLEVLEADPSGIKPPLACFWLEGQSPEPTCPSLAAPLGSRR